MEKVLRNNLSLSIKTTINTSSAIVSGWLRYPRWAYTKAPDKFSYNQPC